MVCAAAAPIDSGLKHARKCIRCAPLNNIFRYCSRAINNRPRPFRVFDRTRREMADERGLGFISARLHFAPRSCGSRCNQRCARARARASYFRSRYSFSCRCNSINSFVGRHRSPRRGEQCYGCRALLHRVHIASGVTTRGCGTAAAPDTFPSRCRRINRCSRKKEPGKRV